MFGGNKMGFDQWDDEAKVTMGGASQTRQFLASRTRRELLGSGVLGLRGRARSCALLGPGPPTLYVCCVLGDPRGRGVCVQLYIPTSSFPSAHLREQPGRGGKFTGAAAW